MKSIKNRIITYLLSGLFLMVMGNAYAQDETWGGDETGEIEDAEVVIEKDREIELPAASRNFEKIPPLPKEKQEASIRPYDFREIDHPWGNLSLNPRALRLKSEPLDKLFGGFLKGGVGNYRTGYAEGYVYNKRNEGFYTGLHAKHRSSGTGPVDKESSSQGYDVVDWAGKSVAGPVKLGGIARYQNSRYNFYGYPDGQSPERDSIRQVFNNFFAQVSVENNNKDLDGDYTLKANYNYLADKYDASESQFNVNLKGRYTFDEKMIFHVKANAFISSYQDIDKLNRNFFRILPYVNYNFGAFDVDAGLNVVIQNDTLQDRGDVLLYPVVGVNYHINDNINAYLRMDGDLDKVSYQSLINENPYLNNQAPILHTNKKFSLDWGVKGSLTSILYFKAGWSFAYNKDMHFFVNDSLDASRFNVMYDHGSVSVMDVYGELTLSKTKKYSLGISGDYFKYNSTEFPHAWHKPAYSVDLISKYNLKDKIIINTDLYLLGGIKALDESGNTKNLDSVIDLNLKLDYLFSEKYSAFIQLNNILGNNYQVYYRYQVKGIQFMGGLSMSF